VPNFSPTSLIGSSMCQQSVSIDASFAEGRFATTASGRRRPGVSARGLDHRARAPLPSAWRRIAGAPSILDARIPPRQKTASYSITRPLYRPVPKRNGAATGFGLAAAGPAWAQIYPTRPVKMVVPLPPGSAPDVRHRLISPASCLFGFPPRNTEAGLRHSYFRLCSRRRAFVAAKDADRQSLSA
jgi:hypothetical protein